MKDWRKLPKHQKIEYLKKEIQTEIERWHRIYKEGCSDPFWHDGTNLNLTRNHILYYQAELNDIYKKDGQVDIYDILQPPEFEVPPKVDEHYMAKDRKLIWER